MTITGLEFPGFELFLLEVEQLVTKTTTIKSAVKGATIFIFLVDLMGFIVFYYNENHSHYANWK